MSEKPIEVFVDREQPGGPIFYDKPRGLWYAVGSGWFHFVMSDYPSGVKPYLYEIEINTKNLFIIKTAREMDEFTEVYGSPTFPDFGGMGRKDEAIDWQLLARGYTGIEISPYIYSRRTELKWYYSWDAASGCIWSKEAFKSVRLVVNLDDENYCRVAKEG